MYTNDDSNPAVISKVVKDLRPFFILKSYLDVSERKQMKKINLYDEVMRIYTKRVEIDPQVTPSMRPHFMKSNRGLVLNGERIWKRAKEYKSNIINIYEPNFPNPKPKILKKVDYKNTFF